MDFLVLDRQEEPQREVGDERAVNGASQSLADDSRIKARIDSHEIHNERTKALPCMLVVRIEPAFRNADDHVDIDEVAPFITIAGSVQLSRAEIAIGSDLIPSSVGSNGSSRNGDDAPMSIVTSDSKPPPRAR